VIVERDTDRATLLFLRDDGTLLGTHTFDSSTSTFTASTTAAGRLWYVASSDDHLRYLTPDGTFETDLGALQDLGNGNFISGLAVRADGKRWAWGVEIAGAVGPTRTRIDVGGVGVATRVTLEEQATNHVLTPIAWTSQGILVARDATGIGGCCYLTPEIAGRDAMLVDPTTLQMTKNWPGCATAAASPEGSFACVTSASRPARLTVHRTTAPDITVTALPPSREVGWALVDDAYNRVVFGAVHSFGNGGSEGPYAVDTESGDLPGGVVSVLADHATPVAALPDGRVVVTSAPARLSGSTSTVSVQAPSGASQQLGPEGAEFVGAFPLPR